MRYRAQLDLLAIDKDLAVIWLDEAGQDLDQGRFTGPIVTNQAQHLSLHQMHIYIAQGFDRAIALDYVLCPYHVWSLRLYHCRPASRNNSRRTSSIIAIKIAAARMMSKGKA